MVLIIPVIFISLQGIMYPEEVWKLQHLLDVKNGEPTEWSLFINRLIGVRFVIASFLVHVYYL